MPATPPFTTSKPPAARTLESERRGPGRPLRIGEILVRNGVLTPQQADQVRAEQAERPAPFGHLAEVMFDIHVQRVESAWVEQYEQYTGLLEDQEGGRIFAAEPDALHVLDARRAWQFRMLPLRFESNGELLIAAGHDRLPRAVTFASAHIPHPVYFRLVARDTLHDLLDRFYPLPGAGEFLMRNM